MITNRKQSYEAAQFNLSAHELQWGGHLVSAAHNLKYHHRSQKQSNSPTARHISSSQIPPPPPGVVFLKEKDNWFDINHSKEPAYCHVFSRNKKWSMLVRSSWRRERIIQQDQNPIGDKNCYGLGLDLQCQTSVWMQFAYLSNLISR